MHLLAKRMSIRFLKDYVSTTSYYVIKKMTSLSDGYVNQENEIEIKKGVMNSAFSFVESSYEKSPEKITTTVQRF